MDLERARRLYETDRRDQARLERVALPPAAGGARGDRRAAAALNRYPDPVRGAAARRSPSATTSTRPGSRSRNGSCEILLAAARGAAASPAPRSSTPGRRSRCTRTSPPLTGATRDPGAAGRRDEHDLDAMLAEITAATRLVLVCNPNNPTGTYLPADADRRLRRARCPTHVDRDPRRGLHRVQTVDDPDATVDLLARYPNLVLLRTFCKVYGLAGLRVRLRARARRSFRAAVDAVRQPFSVNAVAQAAGGRGAPPPGRRHRAGRARPSPSASTSRSGCASSASRTAEIAGQLLLDRPRRPRRGAEIVDGARRAAACSSAPARRSGGPGHIRVTYGTAEENERFLAALRRACSERRSARLSPAAPRVVQTRADGIDADTTDFARPRGRPFGMRIPGPGDLARRSAGQHCPSTCS